jgi:glyoxylase-like metal-dependent hydrolase (beta-lactamase superfamily II)
LLADFVGPDLPALGTAHDLFHDGSLLLFDLPGHARGQMGLLARTRRGRILFAADGAWLKRSIDEQRPPSRLTSLFIDDARAVKTTLQRLHAFQQQQPDIVIIPSHCPATFAQEVEGVDETV